MNVEKNSLRYLRHFENVADELMPVSIGVAQDVYDILNVSEFTVKNRIYEGI